MATQLNPPRCCRFIDGAWTKCYAKIWTDGFKIATAEQQHFCDEDGYCMELDQKRMAEILGEDQR